VLAPELQCSQHFAPSLLITAALLSKQALQASTQQLGDISGRQQLATSRTSGLRTCVGGGTSYTRCPLYTVLMGGTTALRCACRSSSVSTPCRL
jgi:hypothetical protein